MSSSSWSSRFDLLSDDIVLSPTYRHRHQHHTGTGSSPLGEKRALNANSQEEEEEEEEEEENGSRPWSVPQAIFSLLGGSSPW